MTALHLYINFGIIIGLLGIIIMGLYEAVKTLRAIKEGFDKMEKDFE